MSTRETAIQQLDIHSMLTPDRKFKGFETSHDIQETPLHVKHTAPSTCNKLNVYEEEAEIEVANFDPDHFIFNDYQNDEDSNIPTEGVVQTELYHQE